jgi:Peroxiredoxin
MSTSQLERTLQPGDVAPNVVLDAITRQGKVAVDDYRGRTPVLIGIFRGLHCPYCRRHIAAMAQLEPALSDKGIDVLTVVNTPLERARLYFRYRPMPNLLAAADPERASHRAFGLPNLEFTQDESDWPRKVAMSQMMSMKINVTGELPEPLDPMAARRPQQDGRLRDHRCRQQMQATGMGQLVGEFLLDREGIIRWSFTEVPDGGKNLFGGPTPQDLLSAASHLAGQSGQSTLAG